MSDIPEDIRATAQNIAQHIDPTQPRSMAAHAFAAALLAEREAQRERDAKIAEKEGVYPEINIFAGGPEWYLHGKRIAAAIRSPDTTNTTG